MTVGPAALHELLIPRIQQFRHEGANRADHLPRRCHLPLHMGHVLEGPWDLLEAVEEIPAIRLDTLYQVHHDRITQRTKSRVLVLRLLRGEQIQLLLH